MVSCFCHILLERLGREETYAIFADISATSPKISGLVTTACSESYD